MFAQPVRVALNRDDDGVMQQSIQQGAGHDRIAEDLGPFAKPAVAGHDQRTPFVARVNQLEEQVAPPEPTGK